MNRLPAALLSAVLVVLSADTSAASPAAGATFIYRVSNGYSQEVLGKIQYHVDKVDANRVTVSVATDITALGMPHTELYTVDGNWLRHPVTNHDTPTEYEFSPPYPAYVFPLEAGKSWSLRVTATDPVTGQRNSVRVDGEVLGSESVSTPAGAFDTIKVRRHVYAGDWESVRRETNIIETDWYAPALGRTVRSESDSGYLDPTRCSGDSFSYIFPPDSGKSPLLRVTATNPVTGQRNGVRADGEVSGSESKSEWLDPNRFYKYLAGCDLMRGDWNIFELVEIRSAKP
jgi:hypothetical protein